MAKRKKGSQSHWLDGIVPFVRLIANALSAEKGKINALNVFPVADGDTGTNLTETLMGILRDISDLPAEMAPNDILRSVSSSAMRHARGNSGVILAAMINGAVEELEDVEELTVGLFAKALTNADRKAREVVAEPVEGTMLTVIRAMAKAATKAHKEKKTSLSDVAMLTLSAGMNATKETPKLLEALGGMIDSGAYGLVVMAKAACDRIIGEAMSMEEFNSLSELADATTPVEFVDDNLNWKPGTPLYCTEFIWYPDGKTSDAVAKKFLSKMGDSINYLAGHDFTKIHVHTDTSWKVLEYFSKRGELSDVRIHNMRKQTEEHARELAEQQPMKPVGTVVVAAGEGMEMLMRDMGADVVITGGQTANPAVGEILEAIESVRAETVIVLPSNKNVILAAKEAAKLSGKSGMVIETKNMPQSLNALLLLSEAELVSGAPVGDSIESIERSVEKLKVASVTVATIDYNAQDGVKATAGQPIVIVGGKVVSAHADQTEALNGAISELLDDDSAMLTVYLGADWGLLEDTTRENLEESYPNLEITVVSGGQPVYSALVEIQ